MIDDEPLVRDETPLPELGVSVAYWGRGIDATNVDLAVEAESLGYSCAWASEAYSSDANTTLAWIGARTTRIGLGAAVFQIPARSPAMTGMIATTIDRLSAGRFRLGLGVSGPQVSEGWHGVPFARPLGRTREYVEIVRQVIAGDNVRFDGSEYQLPLPGGAGKSLRLAHPPLRRHIPIYLGAVGQASLELTGAVADGWLAAFFDPDTAAPELTALARGRSRSPDPQRPFAITPVVPLAIDEDMDTAARRVAPYCALYIGGMGSPDRNVYADKAARLGYEREARQVQQHFLARDYRKAAAAVPLELIDATSAIGPADRVVNRLRRFRQSGATEVALVPMAPSTSLRIDLLRQLAAAVDATKHAVTRATDLHRPTRNPPAHSVAAERSQTPSGPP